MNVPVGTLAVKNNLCDVTTYSTIDFAILFLRKEIRVLELEDLILRHIKVFRQIKEFAERHILENEKDRAGETECLPASWAAHVVIAVEKFIPKDSFDT